MRSWLSPKTETPVSGFILCWKRPVFLVQLLIHHFRVHVHEKKAGRHKFFSVDDIPNSLAPNQMILNALMVYSNHFQLLVSCYTFLCQNTLSCSEVPIYQKKIFYLVFENETPFCQRKVLFTSWHCDVQNKRIIFCWTCRKVVKAQS